MHTLRCVQAKFGYRLDDPKWSPDWLSNEQLEMLHSDIDARQVIDGEFEQILKDLKVTLYSFLVTVSWSIAGHSWLVSCSLCALNI